MQLPLRLECTVIATSAESKIAKSYHYEPNCWSSIQLNTVCQLSFTDIRRMIGLQIYVDDQLCDVLDRSEALGDRQAVAARSPVPVYIRCSTSPTIGRVVTLVKNTTYAYYYFVYPMNICEVEIWGKYL